MATQKLHAALGRMSSRRTGMRRWRCAAIAGMLGALVGCASDETESVRVGPPNPGIVASTLASCNGSGTDPFSEVSAFRVIAFSEADGRQKTFDQTYGFGGGTGLGVEDVPEGTDVEVTVLGYTSADVPQWYARTDGLVVSAGSTTTVDMVLSRFGGYSCPSTDAAYTQRLFPTATAIGGGKYFLAGGLTESSGDDFNAGVGSDGAWIYDATSGRVTAVGGTMGTGRGAHAAFYAADEAVSRVVLFGGTTKMTFTPNDTDGMGWTWAQADGLTSIEVFEWVTGADPTTGAFRTDVGGVTMPIARVFATADQISPDGLAMVCGGAPWDRVEAGYEQCDVLDTVPSSGDAPTFLQSNNNPVERQMAGAASVVVEADQVTQLLFAGGSRNGSTLQLYTSSTAQKDGVGGAFRGPDGVTNVLPNLHFAEMARLDNGRFVLTGGANWNGAGFDPLSGGNAWTLEIFSQSPLNIIVTPIASFDVGRIFHGVGSPAGSVFVAAGGFSSASELTATGSVRFLTDGGFVAPPDTEEAFAPRGGFGATLLVNDSMLLVGGIDSAADLTGTNAGTLEVYAPSNIPVEQ